MTSRPTISECPRNPQSNSTAAPSPPLKTSAILTPICFPVPSVHRDSLTRLTAFCCILIWHREQIQVKNPGLTILREILQVLGYETRSLILRSRYALLVGR